MSPDNSLVFSAPTTLPTTASNESLWLIGVFFLASAPTTNHPVTPTATNESWCLVGGLSIHHTAHSPPPMRVLMTQWFFLHPRYTCLEGRRRAQHVGIDNIIQKFWSYIHTFSCHIMQTNILLCKISHKTEESGFTMEWKSQTQTSHHVLNTLGFFTVN